MFLLHFLFIFQVYSVLLLLITFIQVCVLQLQYWMWAAVQRHSEASVWLWSSSLQNNSACPQKMNHSPSKTAALQHNRTPSTCQLLLLLQFSSFSSSKTSNLDTKQMSSVNVFILSVAEMRLFICLLHFPSLFLDISRGFFSIINYELGLLHFQSRIKIKVWKMEQYGTEMQEENTSVAKTNFV